MLTCVPICPGSSLQTKPTKEVFPDVSTQATQAWKRTPCRRLSWRTSCSSMISRLSSVCLRFLGLLLRPTSLQARKHHKCCPSSTLVVRALLQLAVVVLLLLLPLLRPTPATLRLQAAAAPHRCTAVPRTNTCCPLSSLALHSDAPNQLCRLQRLRTSTSTALPSPHSARRFSTAAATGLICLQAPTQLQKLLPCPTSSGSSPSMQRRSTPWGTRRLSKESMMHGVSGLSAFAILDFFRAACACSPSVLSSLRELIKLRTCFVRFGSMAALQAGGSSMLSIGWPLGGIFMTIFTASLSELGSAYPVSTHTHSLSGLSSVKANAHLGGSVF